MNKQSNAVIDTSALHSITKNRLMDLNLLLNNRWVKQELINTLRNNLYQNRATHYAPPQETPRTTAILTGIPIEGGGSEELATVFKYINTDVYHTRLRYRGGRSKETSTAPPLLWDFEERNYWGDLTNITAETVSLYATPKDKFNLYLGYKKSFHFQDAEELAKNAINTLQQAVRDADLG